MSNFGIPTGLPQPSSNFGIPTGQPMSNFGIPTGQLHISGSLRVKHVKFRDPYGSNMSNFGIPTGQTCQISGSLSFAIYHSKVIPNRDIPLLRCTSSHSPPEPARVVIYPFLLNTILSTMSDDYEEPSRRGMSALYLAGTVVGTILVLAAFKATFGIDIIGSLVDTVTLVPTRIEAEKNILEGFIEYLTGLFSERLG